MNKPTNPYKRGSTIWKVMEGDWEDLTVRQIAEVLDVKYSTVRTCITRIKRQTGYDVPHISERNAEKKKMITFDARKSDKNPCEGCYYWRPTGHYGHTMDFCCDYILIEHHRRPCPPRENCTVKTLRPQNRRRYPLTVSTEKGIKNGHK